MSRFTNVTAVVTGAASGIGKAVTEQIVAEGGRVIGVDLNAERLDETALAVGDAFTPVLADLTTDDGIQAVVEAGHGATVLVNNAGIMDYFLPVTEVDDELWERVMAVNVTAPMRLMRALVPGMVQAGGGAVVNVGSIGGMVGGAAGIAYTASKHALVGMTRNMAFFYGPQGVRCSIVCPGGVETHIDEGGATPKVDWAWERIQTGFARGQRMAQPSEIAATICHLASAEGANINGAVLASDGGWTAS